MEPIPEEAGAPASAERRWWAAAPDPGLPRVSSRRAYAEVVLVFAGFFATAIAAAALLLAGRYRSVYEPGSWALNSLQALEAVATIGLAVALVLLLAARRGVSAASLGLVLPRTDSGRIAGGRLVRIAAWAMVAQVAGGIVNSALQTGHLPITKSDTVEVVFSVFQAVQAGVVEELVVLAFVVVTLRQARRPWWEVTLVALVLRGSYHIYYGPGVVGILVWAALFYWIFLRFRTVVPLMFCHAAWDTVGFLAERWPAVAGLGAVATLALWVAAPITWLAERNDASTRCARPPAAPVPPGWHPDPSGAHRWRWWDGYRWTDHVS